MAKFKKGDRVRIIDGLLGPWSVPRGTAGTVDEDDDSTPWVLWDQGEGDRRWAAHENRLTLLEKTMENLQPGDILVKDGLNDKREVQGVIGNAVITIDSDDNMATLSSVEQLKRQGWKLESESTDTTEVSLAEIAEKFSIDVAKLRIKKES
jgi:hypothetical protein